MQKSTQKNILCCWKNTCSCPIFNCLKPVKINDSESVSTTQNSCQQIGSELARFYQESLRRTKFVARQDGGRGLEVTQADQNDINGQWSVFFTDLDELSSEYLQHRSTHDMAIMKNLTIRLENAPGGGT